ncbi:hypothetical protein BDF14DRAFT_1137717 [Spinellus fusiger]|nr:hypothetical protein BDF14DRAFT_1137717 [Spinellus fusiger]
MLPLASKCLVPSSFFRSPLLRQCQWTARHAYVTHHSTPKVSSHVSNEPTKSDKSRTYQQRTFAPHYQSKAGEADAHLYTLPSDPYTASARIPLLIMKKGLNEAINFINKLPAHLQSIVVWNILLAECSKEKRGQLGESLFPMLRKKALEPNERTFTLLMSCMSSSKSPDAVEKAEEWMKRIEAFGQKPTLVHLNTLLDVYSKHNRVDKLDQALRSMDKTLPDSITYTIAMESYRQLPEGEGVEAVKALWDRIMDRVDEDRTTYEKNKRITGNQHSKNSSRFVPDDTLITAFFLSLTKTATDSNDLWFGVETVERLYGLRPPKVAATLATQKLDATPFPCYNYEMTPKALYGILRFCGGLTQYQLGVEYCDMALKKFTALEFDEGTSFVYLWLKKKAAFQKNTQYKKFKQR